MDVHHVQPLIQFVYVNDVIYVSNKMLVYEDFYEQYRILFLELIKRMHIAIVFKKKMAIILIKI